MVKFNLWSEINILKFQKMEDIVKRIDALDLNFDKTDFYEIELCSNACFKQKLHHKTEFLTEDENKCFCKFQG
jgi:hypothetical protein